LALEPRIGIGSMPRPSRRLAHRRVARVEADLGDRDRRRAPRRELERPNPACLEELASAPKARPLHGIELDARRMPRVVLEDDVEAGPGIGLDVQPDDLPRWLEPVSEARPVAHARGVRL